MVIWLLSHQRSGSHFLRNTLTSVNGIDPDERLVLVSPGECLSWDDDAIEYEHDDKNWHLWFNLVQQRREQLQACSGAVTDSGNKKLPSSHPGPAWPITVSELESYFLSLKSTYHDSTFLGDVKINQLGFADGLYRSPSAPPSFLFQMITHGKVIFLSRANLLEAYLSGFKAAQAKRWYRPQGESRTLTDHDGDLPSFSVQPEQALWSVNILEEDILLTRKWLRLWGDSVLHVVYEQLFDARTSELNQPQFDRIATFCGLPLQGPWKSESVRTTNSSNLSQVTNRVELERYFRLHGAGHWFESTC